MTHLLRARRVIALALSVSLFFIQLAGASAQQYDRTRDRAGATPLAALTQPPKQDAGHASRPRLVLLIVIDQFRYDYLERFGDLFVAGGIRRLMREGASWTNTNYDHMPTFTAPGHATLMTGAWPAESGIIANEWPGRETGRIETSVEDAGSALLGGEEGEKGSSPRRLMASTLGDEMRIATGGRSKVIGVSQKDRAAILPAGRHASAAYWYATGTGRMVSSSYYFQRLPAWVERWNSARPADKFFGMRWERLLPEAEYLRRAGPDAPPWENLALDVDDEGAAQDTNTFPHLRAGGATRPDKDFYNAILKSSPYCNDLLVDFVEQAIVNEGLGQDDDPDLLTLSFSSNDYVGHRFGPYSQEIMDITLRTDRQISALLDFVNARLGLQKTLVVFTADHGASPIPEHATALGLTGGRVQPEDVLRAVRSAISARYARKNGDKDATADYVQNYYNQSVYFNRAALKRDGVDEEEIERVAGEAAMSVPGVTRYFTRAQLLRGNVPPADPLARRALHGFYPSRSGDLLVVYEPFNYFDNYRLTTGHGSPYSYDTHVPLIIMGGGFKAASHMEAATPADIAPTLAAILGVQAPSNSVGRILTEGLASAPGVLAISR